MKMRLIAVALAACAAPAFAVTTASVTTGNFDFKLKDLNAADGVAPVLTWDATWNLQVSTSLETQLGYEIVTNEWGGKGVVPKFIAGTSPYAATPSPGTAASVDLGSLGGGSISLDADGRPSVAANLSVTEGHRALVQTSFSRGFTLSAGTQVSFTVLADRHLTASAYTGMWTPPDGHSYPMHASVSAWVDFQVGSTESFSQLWGNNGFKWQREALDLVGDADQVKVTLRNTTADSQAYTLWFYSGVATDQLLDPATAAMVPEPSTYALMALGLVGVGVAARRRRG